MHLDQGIVQRVTKLCFQCLDLDWKPICPITMITHEPAWCEGTKVIAMASMDHFMHSKINTYGCCCSHERTTLCTAKSANMTAVVHMTSRFQNAVLSLQALKPSSDFSQNCLAHSHSVLNNQQIRFTFLSMKTSKWVALAPGSLLKTLGVASGWRQFFASRWVKIFWPLLGAVTGPASNILCLRCQCGRLIWRHSKK